MKRIDSWIAQSFLISAIVFIIGTIAMFLGKLTGDWVALVIAIIVPLLTYKGYKRYLNNRK